MHSHRRLFSVLCITILLGADFATGAELKVPAPPLSKFYHGIYPGGISGEEDDITPEDLVSYETALGRRATWVYFSHNWYVNHVFPLKTAQWIREAGAIPFIRLMLRSKNHKIGQGEKNYTLQRIIDGKYDSDLMAWGLAAGKFGSPLIVEYGTEVNADWFGWNGRFHGGGKVQLQNGKELPTGPAKFIQAYRHIVETIQRGGADNITWVFHLDITDSPDKAWNHFENYYPGNDVVDWIGVSCYGALKPGDDKEEGRSFREKFDPVYARIEKMAPEKPVIIAEFGSAARYRYIPPDKWARAALEDIFSGRWPAVRGFSWWNERWENDSNRRHDTTMRMQDIPALRAVFQQELSTNKEKLWER
ncbi:MAG: glycosyl hydrolase [Chthoniobacterales bacterium]